MWPVAVCAPEPEGAKSDRLAPEYKAALALLIVLSHLWHIGSAVGVAVPRHKAQCLLGAHRILGPVQQMQSGGG